MRSSLIFLPRRDAPSAAAPRPTTRASATSAGTAGSSYGTQGPAGSRDEVVAWLEQSLSQLDWIHHVVSNFQIDLDGDRAAVRAMFHCTAQLPGVADALVTGGYYDEEFVRTRDGWKIRRLFEDNRWMQGPAAPGDPAATA